VQQVLEARGLKMFETDELVAEFKAALDSAQEYKREEHVDPLELMRQFLNEITPQIIITDEEGHGNSKQQVTLVNPQVRLPLKGRHILSQRRIYFSANDFVKWCKDRGEPHTNIIYACRREGLLVRSPAAEQRNTWAYPYTLAKGLRGFTAVPMRCYCIRDTLMAAGTGDGTNVVPLEARREEQPEAVDQSADAS
jgi:hypothetical protein